MALNYIEWTLKRDLMVLFESANICNMLEKSFFVTFKHIMTNLGSQLKCVK